MKNIPDTVYALSIEQSRRLKAVRHAPESINGVSPYLAIITWSFSVDPELLSDAVHAVISRNEVLRSKITSPNYSSTPFQTILPTSELRLLDCHSTPPSTSEAFEMLLDHWRGSGYEQALLLTYSLTDSGERCLSLLLSPVFGDLSTLRLFTRDLARLYHQLTLAQTVVQDPAVQFVEVIEFLNERELGTPPLAESKPHAFNASLQPYGFQEKPDGQGICSALVQIDTDAMEQICTVCSRTGVSKEAVLLAASHRVWKRLYLTESSGFTILHEGRAHSELADAYGPYALRQYLPTQWETEQEKSEDVLSKAARFLDASIETDTELAESPGAISLVFECGLGSKCADPTGFQLNLHAAPASTSEVVISFIEGALPSAPGSLILSGHPATTSKLALADLGHMICTEINEWLNPARDCRSLSVNPHKRSNVVQTADLLANLREALRTGAENLAIKSNIQDWTYGQLYNFVNATGWRLLELGATKGRPVVIIDTASHELIGTLCACLLLGAPFVVIDPDAPVKRRNTILDSLQAPLILVAEGGLLAELHAAGAQAIGAGKFVNDAPLPIISLDAEHPAYLIYTSGSTGTPKGVEVGHAALENFLSWMVKTFALTSSDRVLVSTTPTFDVFIREVFWPLLQGATIVLPGRQSNWLDPRTLTALCAKERITHLRLVPSLMLKFVQLGVVLPSTVKRFMSGGEAVSTKLLQDFIALNPLPFCVFYGPTETTINIAFWQGEGHFTPINTPLGSPAAGVQLLILDESFKPVPWGAAGQLSVAGTSLANGYKDDAALSEESFRWLDLGGLEKTRVYLTGDRTRRLPDGSYEFLGRMDDQVKLRGFRIELGEIAHALRQQEGVTDALVLADT
ncbi:amino acid adenylation domain-containing protein, partial [Pseudomonas putida]|nr:amino acid adenylation domain-containing protein [Pseudomonas putida]